MNPNSESEETPERGFSIWHALIGWLIQNRLVALVGLTLLVAGGFYTSPFEHELGDWPRDPVPVDAIPDIGENQQIIFSEWPGRSPRDVEDQISYPLTTALMGIPGVRTVRSSSAFGFSTIYVIFEDGIEFYWSRSRVLEKLASLPVGTVPDGVAPTLGPDATALGQIFWYTLEGQNAAGETVGGWDLDELRSIQDWNVRYALQSVDGVSEVASVGGFVREFQVDVDPEAMRAHGVNLSQVVDAVRKSNLDVGARTLEINGIEYVVRGVGFVQSLQDLESTVIVARENTPIRIRDVARVNWGPSLRRGALDDEGGPTVGGVVVARFMENPRAVIDGVKEKIAQVQAGLPRRVLEDGTLSQVTIVPFYDRTQLIRETLSTLSTALYQEVLITMIVVIVMLRNLHSSLLISAMLPLGVLGSFVVMKVAGVDANIMALGGIAIAIGTMVDISIVFVENIFQRLENESDSAPKFQIVQSAVAEVAPAVWTSVATTMISFLPVLGLSSTELRLFAPLALTKTIAMGVAFAMAVVVLPGVSVWLFGRRNQPLPPRSWIHRGFQLLSLRMWVVFATGCVLSFFDFWAGGFVLLFVLFHALKGMVKGRPHELLVAAENVIAVLLVGVLLALDWMPLGEGRATWINVAFVASIVAGLVGTMRGFEYLYPRILSWVLDHKFEFLLLPLGVVFAGVVAWLGVPRLNAWLPGDIQSSAWMERAAKTFPGLGREYMPPFDEGSYLYMPTTMPHASMGEVLTLLSEMDAAIAEIPEVERAVGKLGRVDSALDPAPISIIETVVTYKPEFRIDDNGEQVRQWRDHIHSTRDIWDEVVRAAQRPGLTSAPMLMPIGARIVMLQSGMRAPMGIKIHGPDLDTIEEFGRDVETILKRVESLRADTVFADRVVGKPYLEIEIDREAAGRYGLSIVEVQNVLQVALGGMTLTRVIDGRERYPVRVRYMREKRDSLEALQRVFVTSSTGEQIPLAQLAHIRYIRGPQVIKAEDTFLTSYVLFDREPDVAEMQAVLDARAAIDLAIENGELTIPSGVRFEFAGSYENQLRSEQRLAILIPVALALVFVFLYLQFHRVSTTAMIYSGVVVSVSGGFILLWCYGQPWFMDFSVLGVPMRELLGVRPVNLSVGVWIGFIALIGIATDDGVVMSTYLHQRFDGSKIESIQDIRSRVLDAGTRRVRPCLMTTATTILALMPVLTSRGRGADLMMPMALPSVGGMMIELMTLFVVPVLFCAREERRLQQASPHKSSSLISTLEIDD